MGLFTEPPAGVSILALDPGSHLGWAQLFPDATIAHGTHTLPSPALNYRHRRWEALRRFLQGRREASNGQIDAVWFEFAQFIMPKQAISALDRGGFAAVLMTWCGYHGIPYEPVLQPQTPRKTVIGNGKATKDQVRKNLELLGFKTKDTDESDALCILLHAMAQVQFGRAA